MFVYLFVDVVCFVSMVMEHAVVCKHDSAASASCEIISDVTSQKLELQVSTPDHVTASQ